MTLLAMSRPLKGEPFLVMTLGVLSLFVIVLLLPMISIFLFLKPSVVEKVFISSELASEVRSALATTLEASITSTLILALLGIPSAYYLTRREFKGKATLEGLLDIPLAVPHTIAGIMILTGFGRRGLLGPLTTSLGIRISDSFWGIVAAMLFVSSPLMLDTAKAGFHSVDPMLEAVSRSLGAGALRTFTRITLPLSWRNIVAGTILAWARALSEVGSILVVAYFPKTMNILILEFLNEFGLPYAIALAVPYLLLTLVLFILLRLFIGQKFMSW